MLGINTPQGFKHTRLTSGDVLWFDVNAGKIRFWRTHDIVTVDGTIHREINDIEPILAHSPPVSMALTSFPMGKMEFSLDLLNVLGTVSGLLFIGDDRQTPFPKEASANPWPLTFAVFAEDDMRRIRDQIKVVSLEREGSIGLDAITVTTPLVGSVTRALRPAGAVAVGFYQHH